MKEKVGHSPSAGHFSVNRFVQGYLTPIGEGVFRPVASCSRQGRRQVYLALAVVGMLLIGAPSPSRAEALEACALGSSNEAEIIDAACCPGDVLSAYWPGRSPELTQIFCQLLVFPTATLPNADEFNQRIVDGSLSGDSRRASAEAMTLPSLWWNRDTLTPQLGGRRLVQSWISYQIKDSSTAVVDVMINPQMWSVLTYNERFAVLNQFGTSARDFGYNLRFFQGNARNYRMVGLYACEFTTPPGTSLTATADVDSCSANLDAAQIVLVQRRLLAEEASRQQPPSAPVQAVATDSDL